MAETHDTSDIQQELDTIVAEARTVNTRLEQVQHKFDAIAALLDDLQGVTNDAKTKIEHGLDDSSKHVQTLVQDLDAAMTKVIDHDNDFRQAVHAMMQHLLDDANGFKQSVDKVLVAVDKSHTVAEQLGATVSQTDHDHHDGARQSVQLMQDDLAQFVQHFDGTTQPAMNSLHDDLEHLQQRSEADTSETHDHMAEVMHEVDTHLQQGLLDPVAAHVNEHGERMNQIATGDIDAQFHAILASQREGLENRFKSQFSEVMDKIDHDLDQVEQQIKQSGEHSAIPREAMKPLLDGMEGVFKELHPVVNTVKDIAAAVGVDL